jgi:hypothetical protein
VGLAFPFVVVRECVCESEREKGREGFVEKKGKDKGKDI